MNGYFNLKLYREGLKKVRLSAISAGVVLFLLCGLIPVTDMLNSSGYDTDYTTIIEITEIALPLILILCFTPFLVWHMFSYLNKRSDSDFYHSIPYKRECVFFSFTAAILTWIFGIIIACVGVSGILWTIHPHVTFAVTDLFQLMLAYFISTAFLSGVMLVAMMITGTTATNFFIAGLLVSFVRILGGLVQKALDEILPVFILSASPFRFLSWDFSMTIRMLSSVMGSQSGLDVYGNVSLLVYTGVWAIVLIGLACFLYRIRKSEMAGKSAPNRILQHVYRIAFTTPFVLIFATYLLTNRNSFGQVLPNVLALTILVLIVYYLYELITTKKFRQLVKATPYLGVLVLIAGIFVGSLWGVRSIVLNENLRAEDIDSVGYYSSVDTSNADYFSLLTDKVTVRNDQAIALLANALSKSEEAVKTGTFWNMYDSFNSFDPNKIPTKYDHRSVLIHLKNGRNVVRYVRMTEEESETYRQLLFASSEYRELAIQLPKESEILSIYGSHLACWDPENIRKIWTALEKDFEKLSEEQKLMVLSGESGGRDKICLDVWGVYRMQKYSLTVVISEDMPETLRALYEVMQIDMTDPATFETEIDRLLNIWKSEKIFDKTCYLDMRLYSNSGVQEGRYSVWTNSVGEGCGDLQKFCELLDLMDGIQAPSNTEYQGKWVCITINTIEELHDSYGIYVFALTEEQYEAFYRFLERTSEDDTKDDGFDTEIVETP